MSELLQLNLISNINVKLHRIVNTVWVINLMWLMIILFVQMVSNDATITGYVPHVSLPKRVELTKPTTLSCMFTFSAHSQNTALQSGSFDVRCCKICSFYRDRMLAWKMRMALLWLISICAERCQVSSVLLLKNLLFYSYK